MPIYEYKCDGKDELTAHVFEKIVPMSDMDKPQTCEEHGKECTRVEFSKPGQFVWGKEVVHWAAGLGSRGIM